MQKMLICGLLALAACGGGQKPAAAPSNGSTSALSNTTRADPAPPKTDMDLALDKMRAFRDQLCACKDSPCAQKVSDEMTMWGQEMATKQQGAEPPKFTEAQQKDMQEIGTQMGDCMMHAMQMKSSPNQSGGSNPCGGGP